MEVVGGLVLLTALRIKYSIEIERIEQDEWNAHFQERLWDEPPSR
jgi:hypothetical protein